MYIYILNLLEINNLQHQSADLCQGNSRTAVEAGQGWYHTDYTSEQWGSHSHCLVQSHTGTD